MIESEICGLRYEHFVSFTRSSQEALEATFDLSIRVCYSWSFAPRLLDVPVSSHSFVVEPLEVCVTPSLRENK